MTQFRQRIRIQIFLSVAIALFIGYVRPAYSDSLAPIELAQAPQVPSLYPTDVTPVNIGRERELLKPGFNYYLFNNLPNRLWFNAIIETSQRYEANVFFSRTRYVSDYVYRILPNITLGYEGPKKVSIYCNYFMIKDVFVGHSQLTFPTTQSLSWGFRRAFNITPRTNLQLDWQNRELWQTTGLHQFDFIPALTLTRFVTPRTIVYFNTLLQMRGGNYFCAPTREIDPFYTIGALHTKGNWVFSAVGTLVTNFRHPPFNDSIPPFSNNSIICDFEVNHPVPKFHRLIAFVRAEPIWNWNGHGEQGISGFDFRLFGGLRVSLAKPTYASAVKGLEQQWKQQVRPATSPSGEVIPPPPSTERSDQPLGAPNAGAPAGNQLEPVPLHAEPKNLKPTENSGESKKSEKSTSNGPPSGNAEKEEPLIEAAPENAM